MNQNQFHSFSINDNNLNCGFCFFYFFFIKFQYPVIKINLESINSLIRRRFVLQQIVIDSNGFIFRRRLYNSLVLLFSFLQGLEIKWTENDMKRLLYVSFRNKSECDEFYVQTISQSCVRITHTEPESMTLKWQNGIISNYEYLLYLNR